MTTPTRIPGRGGRLPYDNSRANLRVAIDRHFFNATLPEVPASLDNLTAVAKAQTGIPMYLNDRIGDCVWAMIGHYIQISTTLAGNEVTVSDDAVLQGYKDVAGYDPDLTDSDGNNPTDVGTNVQQALEYWQKVGIRLHEGSMHKIVAFAEVNFRDMQLVKTAMKLFDGALVGVNLPASAEEQFSDHKPWVVVQGSRDLGGHAICGGAYDTGVDGKVLTKGETWAAIQDIDEDWWMTYVEECWVVVTREKLDQIKKGTTGFNLQQFEEDYQALTGRTFRVQPDPVVPPAPDPAPNPTPSGECAEGWDEFVDAARQWLQHRHVGYNETFHNAVLRYLDANGVLPHNGG